MVNVPQKTRPRLFLIDGYALIYRAFFAMINRPLITTRGENTSAAFGFTRFIMNILEDHAPDYLAVVLDAGSSKRNERYPAYKATRQKMPPDLQVQLPRITHLVDAFRIPVITLPDHEADDVIGTLAMRAKEQGIETVIVSGDKDFYQLLQPGVCLLNPGRGGQSMIDEEWVDTSNARERLGVAPEHVVDYLALIGDSSDNIPGAPGIGPKTAIQLIDQFGAVENILDHAAEVGNKRAREALQNHAEDVRLSKELVTIKCDLPVTLDLDALTTREPDRTRLRQLFIDLEFTTLVREYAAPVEETKPRDRNYALVKETRQIDDLVARARKLGYIALDCETSEPDPMRGYIVGIGVAFEPTEAFYLPFGHHQPGMLALDGPASSNLPPLKSAALQEFVALLRDAGIRKIGHNLKHDYLALRRAGVELGGIEFDTMVASYVMDPGRRDHSLDALAMQHFDYRTTTYEELCGKGKDFRPISECAVEKVKDYACEDADIAISLDQKLRVDLETQDLEKLYRTIELPLIHVLADMEWVGIGIDFEFFKRFAQRLEQDLRLVEEEIHKEAGTAFNINSTLQLKEILFDKLKLPVVKKTKTGPSTDASVLQELAEMGHRLPQLIMEYRQLEKLRGTYVDALPQLVNPDTRRIHTNFNQTVAATGRLSSSDPNLQNIPIRTQTGAEIRKGFVPAPGFVFMSADYSQIELRILAHMAADEMLIEAFESGGDVHKRTAALVFDVPIEKVTPDMRAAAKTINFATIYGQGPFALSNQLGISVSEAKTFIEQYFERFSGVRTFLDAMKTQAKEKGYVETISGRRRYIPEIHSPNHNIRSFGERAAQNAPVQGSAADIIKIAMININHALAEQGSTARMLLQVHDELVFELPADKVEETRAFILDLMRNAVPLRVPLEVASGIGQNWFECK
ncbi:MAG TPA: DNA polymerase I [Longimicrobiales bacterium]